MQMQCPHLFDLLFCLMPNNGNILLESRLDHLFCVYRIQNQLNHSARHTPHALQCQHCRNSTCECLLFALFVFLVSKFCHCYVHPFELFEVYAIPTWWVFPCLDIVTVHALFPYGVRNFEDIDPNRGYLELFQFFF